MGGFFNNDGGADGQIEGQVGQQDVVANPTSEQSPGGLFEDGRPTDGGTSNAANAADAEEAAKDARGWAVGDTDGPLDGWSATNNSKYYSEQSAKRDSEAAVFAQEAMVSAQNAATSASEADRDADRAATEAALAAQAQAAAEVARNKADSDARVADSEAELARMYAEGAKRDSENVADITRIIKNDSEAITGIERIIKLDSENASDIQRAIKGDSEDIRNTQRKVDSDSRQADSDAHFAELQADIAQVYADGTGPLASYWASSDTEQGSHVIADSEFNGVNRFFDLRGLGSERGTSIVGHTYRVYINFNMIQEVGNWQIVDNPSIAVNDHAHLDFFPGSAFIPQMGDRVDVFLIPPGNRTYGPHSHPYISAETSAIWQAGIATHHALNAVVHDTDITVVAGLGLNGGGTFTTNQADSENITVNLDSDNIADVSRSGNTITLTRADADTFAFDIGGSVNPTQANLVLTLSATDTELSSSANTKTITATLTANTGFTLSNGSVSVKDQHNADVTVSGSGDTFTFSVDRTIAGSLRVTGNATLTRTSDSQAFNESRSRDFHVDRGWYTAYVSTAPTAVSSMTDEGVWTGADSETFTTTATGSRQAYVALPTRSGGYRFSTGTLVVTADSSSVISVSWTLYGFTGISDGLAGTVVLKVREA